MLLLNVLADASPVAADAAQKTAELVASAGSDNGAQFMLLLTIFVMSVFVGVEIIAKIPPTLHTPLMSGSNAISGITLLGAILAGGDGSGWLATILGFVAVVLATINVVGGFVVTDRMLGMFKSRK